MTLAVQALHTQQSSIAERLGYPKDTKLLIIHADDLGVAHSENRASLKAFEQGSVNSGSVMVPCPWFLEIAAYAKTHTTHDIGVHLTLTSEWKQYKWGPVLQHENTQSLTDANGHFPDNVADVVTNADVMVLKKELEAQVRLALDAGIDVTHLDAHMGAVMATPEFLKAYIEIGKAHQLPVLLVEAIAGLQDPSVRALLDAQDVLVDSVYSASPEDYAQGMASYYEQVLTNLGPGLNCILIHTAFDDAEMQAVTVDHPNWGAAWRQADFDFFTSESCRELLREQQIQLVTWREIRDEITRGGR